MKKLAEQFGIRGFGDDVQAPEDVPELMEGGPPPVVTVRRLAVPGDRIIDPAYLNLDEED
ncbi:MAG: hypothetical protein LBT40_15915 [Deltaproteobacteria bacterium]|jgi:hypothetical protein|nr:hypothetical protein [Deltaproteobacteria bacterium]